MNDKDSELEKRKLLLNHLKFFVVSSINFIVKNFLLAGFTILKKYLIT